MSIRVLIVDDLAFIKLIIRDILEKRGLEVAGEASNGIEAVGYAGPATRGKINEI